MNIDPTATLAVISDLALRLAIAENRIAQLEAQLAAAAEKDDE